MWRNRHQLMSRFAEFNNVMYVEPKVPLNALRQSLSQKGLKKGMIFKNIFQKRVERVLDNLYVYHSPNFIPISGRFPFSKMTWWAWVLFLKLTLKRLGFHDPILWFSRPYMINILKCFNAKLKIYHIVDEYSAYGKMNSKEKRRVEKLEQEMARKSDLVFVVSEELFRAKIRFNKNTYFVPNGVDFELYERTLEDKVHKPSDIAALPSPIIGYSGLISNRLDLGLVEYIASSRPQWSIAMIGSVSNKCAEALNRLCKLENIHFLGLKKYTKVPIYVKAFDICITPYRITEETQNLSSLKLYEYSAMGKPIISTNFKSARKVKKIIRIADSKEKFLRCIEDALLEKDPHLVFERRKYASSNTWDRRVTQISKIIQFHLNNGYNI
ncbi:glycosyltransferase [Desulfobacterales bacterium]|nr:glycosyltransferase [Desulfobacterales bacterium]